jgi:hypothetical protein
VASCDQEQAAAEWVIRVLVNCRRSRLRRGAEHAPRARSPLAPVAFDGSSYGLFGPCPVTGEMQDLREIERSVTLMLYRRLGPFMLLTLGDLARWPDLWR